MRLYAVTIFGGFFALHLCFQIRYICFHLRVIITSERIEFHHIPLLLKASARFAFRLKMHFKRTAYHRSLVFLADAARDRLHKDAYTFIILISNSDNMHTRVLELPHRF